MKSKLSCVSQGEGRARALELFWPAICHSNQLFAFGYRAAATQTDLHTIYEYLPPRLE
jgi:hypothetical protein